MDRAELLTEAQAFAEEGMVDACTIQRRTGSVTDPFSGVETPTDELIYAGKCRVQQSTAQANQQEAGQAHVLMQELQLQLPVSATGVDVGDRVTLTAAGRDPDLVGRVFTVWDLAYKTDASARRLRVQERTS